MYELIIICLLFYYNQISLKIVSFIRPRSIYLHTSTYHLYIYRRHILNYNPHVNCTSYRCLFLSECKNPLQTGTCPNRNISLSPRHSGMDRFYCIYTRSKHLPLARSLYAEPGARTQELYIKFLLETMY